MCLKLRQNVNIYSYVGRSQQTRKVKNCYFCETVIFKRWHANSVECLIGTINVASTETIIHEIICSVIHTKYTLHQNW